MAKDFFRAKCRFDEVNQFVDAFHDQIRGDGMKALGNRFYGHRHSFLSGVKSRIRIGPSIGESRADWTKSSVSQTSQVVHLPLVPIPRLENE
jgi:hypothetical protein